MFGACADLGSFIFYNASSQHSIFDEVLEADEHADLDHHEDVAKPKFTFTECIVAIILSLAIVTMLAVFLIVRIEDVVEAGIPDQFLGLIMLPLVEKAAEHLTAVDEAWDGQIVSHSLRPMACSVSKFCRSAKIAQILAEDLSISLAIFSFYCTIRRAIAGLTNSSQNFALFHCIGPSIQTALFNAPLVVVVGWALGKDMDLNFEIFMIVLLVLSIVVVGNFLRDGESNYLEGSLLVVSCVISYADRKLTMTQIVYIIVAVASWYYPNPDVATSNGGLDG